MIFLFEDNKFNDLNPFSKLRFCFDLKVGRYSLYEYIEKFKNTEDIFGLSSRTTLINLYKESNWLPKINIKNTVKCEDTVFINSRIVPNLKNIEKLFSILDNKNEIAIFKDEDLIAYKGEANFEYDFKNLKKISLETQNIENIEIDLLNYTWDIIYKNMEILNEHLEINLEQHNKIQKNVFVGKNVEIDKTAILDTTHGKIVLDNNVKIKAYSILKGPLYIGENSTINEYCILKDGCSIGKSCKIGGEIESSIIYDFTNKQHHGFLGHSFIGSWVNIGAGSSNSDLKNTYGEIKILHNGEKINTQKTFLGCMIGDFSKLAINTSVYTGKIIGINSHVFGNILENVEDFCLYQKNIGLENQRYNLQSAIITQKRMFERRNIQQTNSDIKILEMIGK